MSFAARARCICSGDGPEGSIEEALESCLSLGIGISCISVSRGPILREGGRSYDGFPEVKGGSVGQANAMGVIGEDGGVEAEGMDGIAVKGRRRD